MRLNVVYIFVFVTISLIFSCALTAQKSRVEAAQRDVPQIIVDEQANTVRILIDGQERARIDADGLHVEGNISYAGTIADAGHQRKAEANDAQ